MSRLTSLWDSYLPQSRREAEERHGFSDKRALKPAIVALFPGSFKRRSELSYWKQRYFAEG